MARDVAQLFLADQVDTPHLMRHMMAAEWLVPAHADSEGAVAPSLFARPGGDHSLLLFSDLEAVHQAEAGHLLEAPLLQARGSTLLASLGETLDQVVLNPGTPLAVHWQRHQIPGLQGWARTAIVEAILADAAQVREALATLQAYDGWRVALAEDHLLLAPDAQERSLAAVFTSEDAAVAFTADRVAAVELRRITGRRLFPWLATLALDGVVFNCAGPVATSRWSHALVARLAAASS